MPFNVLLLPLLGGYLFISYWNRTRFTSRRETGQRLLIDAALAGVFFLVVSYGLVRLIVVLWPEAYVAWQAIAPFEYVGVSFGALLLGATVWWPLNRFAFARDAERRRAILRWNDYLELLLIRAIDETHEIALTLKNRKLYVGFVANNIDPTYDRKYIVVLPTASGFRNHVTHDVTFTTNYTRVYEELIAARASRLVRGVDDFCIVIPVAEVISANLFDWDAYRRFDVPQAAA